MKVRDRGGVGDKESRLSGDCTETAKGLGDTVVGSHVLDGGDAKVWSVGNLDLHGSLSSDEVERRRLRLGPREEVNSRTPNDLHLPGPPTAARAPLSVSPPRTAGSRLQRAPH